VWTFPFCLVNRLDLLVDPFSLQASTVFIFITINLYIMQTDILLDPKEKKEEEEKSVEQQQNEDGVVLLNDDGTEFDSSERTYVSVDLPEDEEASADEKSSE
jgi:hypothetical protein